MQRFYQAVELDEAEMSRKRGSSVDPINKKSKSSKQKEEIDELKFDSLVMRFHFLKITISNNYKNFFL